MKIIIKNGIIIQDENTIIDNGNVLIEDGLIKAINTNEKADKVIDAKGNYIIPALLDVHTHGAMGYDFNTCSYKDIDKIADYYKTEGVTSFLATLVCETHEDLKKIILELSKSNNKALVGIYLEGPFLSKEKKAVMKEECIVPIDLEHFKEYVSLSKKVKAMTLAPELDKADELIKMANDLNVAINIGHSNASSQDVLKAEKIGAKGITHLYNAMSQHEHRNPGVVTGAILSNLYTELICDGFHVSEDIVKATYKMIGKDRLILISDANPCKGLSDGNYEFSGKKVIVEDGKVTVKETGRIAGGTLKVNVACQNMMKWCNASIKDCVQMASMNPSKLYNLNKGYIKEGYDGDILVVDKDFNLLHLVSEETIWY